MKILLEYFLSLIFPPACAACGKLLHPAARAPMLCSRCGADIERVSPPVCTVCGIPFISAAGTSHICGKCMKARPAFDSARALFVYGGTVKKLIHRAKFHGDGYALGVLCMIAGKSMAISDFSSWAVVIPVPLHILRLRSRGFNQAAVMAGRLFPRDMVDVNLLSRIRNTRPQMNLSATERRVNIKGAFRVAGELSDVDGILLFDDIFTTGSTVESAARELKNAGAGRVDVLTLACAVKRVRPDGAGILKE